MKCKTCGRDNLTERELDVHTRYFHKKPPESTGHQQPQKFASGACPDCGATLWFEEGCATCHSCGYSKCN